MTRRSLAAVLATAVVAVTACSRPSLYADVCTRAAENDPTLMTLSSRLRVPASLRNGQIVRAPGGGRFVSAELHRPAEEFEAAGEILTWMTDGDDTFASVDRNARRLSSWPAAKGVDLTSPEARTSRGCVYPLRGQVVCVRQTAANSPIPVSGSCTTSSSTTPTTEAQRLGG